MSSYCSIMESQLAGIRASVTPSAYSTPETLHTSFCFGLMTTCKLANFADKKDTGNQEG